MEGADSLPAVTSTCWRPVVTDPTATPRLRRVREIRGRSTSRRSTSSTLTIVAGRGPGRAGSSGAPSSDSRTNCAGAPSTVPGSDRTIRRPTSDIPRRGKPTLSS